MEPLFNPKSVYTWNRRSDSFILDISLDDYTDIFDEWDFSPYRKRDIDSGFFQFLMESSQELPLKKNLSILFHLPENVFDDHKEKNSRKGIQNYLRYQLKKQQTEKRKQLTHTLWYTIFGVVFLVLGYILQRFVESVFLLTLLPEGLFIGGWVLFWESFSIVFFKTRDINILIKHYYRLINSEYRFRYETQEVSDGAGQTHDNS